MNHVEGSGPIENCSNTGCRTVAAWGVQSQYFKYWFEIRLTSDYLEHHYDFWQILRGEPSGEPHGVLGVQFEVFGSLKVVSLSSLKDVIISV